MGALARLWADDGGAVLSVEYTMLVSLLVFGAGAGLVAARNDIAAGLAATGAGVRAALPDPADMRAAVAPPRPSPAAVAATPVRIVTTAADYPAP